MWKQAVNLALLSLGAGVLWLVDRIYEQDYLYRGALTLALLVVIYLVFSVVLPFLFSPRIADPKTKYQLRKIFSILNVATSLAVMVSIWVTDPQALVVSYGLLAAGLAIALQDMFRNMAGGLIVYVQSPFRVGDRIKIREVVGDVIDINIMYTVLLELREWVDGDQATGRLVMVPNGYLLSSNVYNYTRDNSFLWDELVVPVPYDCDWRGVAEAVGSLVEKETAKVTEKATQELSSMMGKYYLTSKEVRPGVFLALTSNYLELHVRFICLVRERRKANSHLARLVLEEMERMGVRVGSTTVEITRFPHPPARPDVSDGMMYKEKVY